jgi:hypothetical protein
MNLIKNEDINRVAEIKHKYAQSLISIGTDPTNKDLLEIITHLLDELNKTISVLSDLKNEFHTFKKEILKEKGQRGV